MSDRLPDSPTANRWLVPLGVAAVMLVFLFPVSARSFWIDEAWTAHFAHMDTLQQWWASLVAERETNLQMPFYSAWIWAVEKVVGRSEFGLRYVNLCWFVPALLVLLKAFASRPMRLAVLLTVSLSAFAWYYLDEARSYTMQFSSAIVVYAAAWRLTSNDFNDSREERNWVLLFVVGMILLCGSSLLSMFLASIPLAGLVVMLTRRRLFDLIRSHPAALALLVTSLVVLFAYYCWTLRLGARATGIAGTDWRNVMFVVYELAGFSGLGPGREQLRAEGMAVFAPYLVGLLVYAVVVSLLVGMTIWDLRRIGGRKLCLIALALAVPVLMLFMASHMKHFRVLGRHFAGIAPVFYLLAARGMVLAWQRGRIGRGAVVLFLALSLVSVLSVRFAARHGRDDYRSAATAAKSALLAGQRVWWNADPKAANYYGVDLGSAAVPPHALCLLNPSNTVLDDLPPPDLVISSRPEAFDMESQLGGYLEDHGFVPGHQVRGFTIWQARARQELR